jgi:hypothetical protein
MAGFGRIAGSEGGRLHSRRIILTLRLPASPGGFFHNLEICHRYYIRLTLIA